MTGPANFLDGLPVEVDPESIERQLGLLWKPTSESQGGEGAVVRACLANLVVHVADGRDVLAVTNVLDEVSRSFPNRTQLLLAESAAAAPAGLRATVSAVCHSGASGMAPVCCEQIRWLAADEKDAEHFAGAVAPLLVADIPVYLWWSGALSHPLLHRLASQADRVIVDSRKGGSDTSPFTSIRNFVRDCTLDDTFRDVVDLGWRSTAVWRKTVADIFDDTTVRAILPRLARVEVEKTPVSDLSDQPDLPDSQTAVLLAGWIASRVRWDIETVDEQPGGSEIICSSPRGGRGTITIRSRNNPGLSHLRAGTPVALRFHTQNSTAEELVAVELDPRAPETARVTYKTSQVCLLPKVVPFPHPSEAALVHEALESPSYAGVYGEALEKAIRIAMC